MVAAFASAIGWQMWELHLYNTAVREAKEAGFLWKCEGTLSFIWTEWRNVWNKETREEHPRVLVMRRFPCLELDRFREMLHRLRPTELHVYGYDDQNVDALKGLTDLQYLKLIRFPALQNVDALKNLNGLQSLDLRFCNRIPAVALRELRAALPNTDITFPDGSKNPPQ